MKIEVWADFVCPFCYIGKRQLELALNHIPFKKHILIEYKSYEIYPNNHNESKRLQDILNDKYGISVKHLQNIVKHAEKIGILYQLDLLMHVNTFNAHRLLKYACTQNKQDEVVERLLKGYFIEREKINEYETIMKICDELSLNKNEVNTLLNSNKFSQAVQCDQLEADEIGIEQTPFFLFNEELALSGIQSIDIFKEAIEVTWEQMGKKPMFSKMKRSETTYCTGENCGD